MFLLLFNQSFRTQGRHCTDWELRPKRGCQGISLSFFPHIQLAQINVSLLLFLPFPLPHLSLRYRPSLPRPSVFRLDHTFREVLLTKLVNGERASYHCSTKVRTQKRSLVELTQMTRKGQMDYALSQVIFCINLVFCFLSIGGNVKGSFLPPPHNNNNNHNNNR